tara:strand:- start:909 stop:1115 length:207 start_codon:yes stop_codon:yes gene_type:complete
MTKVEKRKLANKRLYLKNRLQRLEYQKQYDQDNREKRQAYLREYYLENKEKYVEYRKKYANNKMKEVK